MNATSLDELRAYYSGKLKLERKRLKSFGTKPDSFSLSYAITPDIIAHMSKARWTEVTDIIHWIRQQFPKATRPKSVKKILRYLIKDRQEALCKMKDLLAQVAADKESKRPWKGQLPRYETPVEKKSSSSKSKKEKRMSSEGLPRKKKHKR